MRTPDPGYPRQRDFCRTDHPKAGIPLSSVIANYKQSAYRAVKYLAGKGCKEIGLINGPMSLPTYYERYQGYKKPSLNSV